MRKKNDLIFLISAMTVAVICRGILLFRDLEYDEIWTLVNYAKLPLTGIFSELLTPNNHPWNTLLVKLLYFSREYFWTIRLGSLAFSLGSIYLLFELGKLFYRRYGAYFAAAAGAILPPVIVAGSTARGYAGQLFFLLLCALSLLKCRKGSLPWSTVAAVSGLLAVTALPTSVLYLAPMGIAFLIYLIKRRRFIPGQLAIFMIAALAAAAWYAVNWQDFTHTANFKENIDSAGTFFHWLNEIFLCNAVPWMLLGAAFFRKKQWRAAAVLFSILLFAPAAAIFTSPAPYRIYLPGITAGTLLLLPPLRSGRYRIIAATVMLLIQSAVSWQVFPDTRITDEMTAFTGTDGVITVYGANESLPVLWNHPGSVEIFFRQLAAAAPKDKCALLLAGNEISGVTSSGQTVTMDFSGKVHHLKNGASPVLLPLKKNPHLAPGEIAFALLPPVPAEVIRNNINFLQTKDIIYLNFRQSIALTAPDGSTHRFALLLFRPGTERRFPKEAPIFVPAIEK